MIVSRAVVSGLMVCLALTGCGGDEGSDNKESRKAEAGGSSPEDVFKQAKAALEKDDWEAFARLYPKQGQAKLVGMMAKFGPRMAKKEGAKEALDAIVKKHGIKTDVEVDMSSPAKAGPGLEKMTADVKDLNQATVDILEWTAKYSTHGPKDKMPTGDLTDLKTEGNYASGTAKYTKKDGSVGDDTHHFIKVDGRWYLDMDEGSNKTG